MRNVAINSYTLRDLEESVAATTDRIIDAGYDGVQYAGDLDDLNADIATQLSEAGLKAVPIHVTADHIEDHFETVVETCETVDAGGVVVPWGGPERFESRERVEAFADRLAALDEQLNEAGLDLHFHNHYHEFGPLEDGSLGQEILAERTDIQFELDVGWVHASGEDPVEWLQRLSGRCSLVHIKDVRVEEWEGTHPARPVEVGSGDVDIEACVEAAEAIGTEWLTYEHDVPEEPLESLSHGVEYLRDR